MGVVFYFPLSRSPKVIADVHEVLDRASSYGIGIVRQVGEGVEIGANNLKVY